jgi:hypothetical protein
MKSEQKNQIGFPEYLERISVEQKNQIGFPELLDEILDWVDEISAKAWLKWTEDEEKKRKIKKTEQHAKKSLESTRQYSRRKVCLPQTS